MKTDIHDQCHGLWSQVLSNIGVNDDLFNGKYHTCPYCGRNKKARWQKNKQRLVCVCGTHQPMDIAKDYLNRDFKETAFYIRNNILGLDMKAEKIVDDTEKNRLRLKMIHSGLKRITKDDPAGKYLMRRGIAQSPANNVYFHPSLKYWTEEGGEWICTGTYPALVAVIRNPSGETVSMQVHYLTEDGHRAKLDPPFKNMSPSGKLDGANIGLFDATSKNDALAISEGLINGLWFAQDTGINTTCLISAEGMKKAVIPEHVRHVYIIEDCDISFTGMAAAATLANRLKVVEKKDVTIVRLSQDDQGNISCVYISPKVDIDYADYGLSRNAA